MRELTDSFIDALHQLHVDQDASPLAQLFAENATLSKLGDQNEASGPEGARRFWQEYRAVFDEVEATFTSTIASQDIVALEWTSSGALAGGRPFSYAGISVIEGDGSLITGFRTYYDSAAFVGLDA